MGRARHLQRRFPALTWHLIPFSSSFPLLPDEAAISPFQKKVPSCEGVQHPQQGISGHSWFYEIKDILVIQRRKQKSTSSSGGSLHTHTPVQHLPSSLLKSGQRAVKEEKENCLHGKRIVWLISQWLKQFRAISRIRARDLLCLIRQISRGRRCLCLQRFKPWGFLWECVPALLRALDTSHAGTSLSLPATPGNLLLLQSIRLD